MSADCAGLAVVVALLAGVLVAAEALRARGVAAEATRKLVHTGSGLVTVLFPWVFGGAWPVLLLAAGYSGLLAFAAVDGRLRSVHGVCRRSAGAFCFPVAIAATFALAGRRPHAYVPAVLVLSLGDTAAALVGRAYGVTRYRVCGSGRTVEGSTAFFVCALPCVHLPLLLLTPLAPASLVAWTVSVALLATCAEALSCDGVDNLVVPVLVAVVLLLPLDERSSLALVLALLTFAAATLGLAARARKAVRLRRVRSY